MVGNDRVRALIWQMNFYDVQSQIYTTISILFERSAAGLFQGSKVEILPFYMPLANLPQNEVALMVLRTLATFWLVVNTCITLFKKRKLIEIFTMMTFWDTWLSMIVIGLQIANISYIIHYNSTFVGTPQEFLKEETRTQFHLLRAYGYRW